MLSGEGSARGGEGRECGMGGLGFGGRIGLGILEGRPSAEEGHRTGRAAGGGDVVWKISLYRVAEFPRIYPPQQAARPRRSSVYWMVPQPSAVLRLCHGRCHWAHYPPFPLFERSPFLGICIAF
jgi:hypothetical protein